MKVIGENRETKQIDPEVSCKQFELVFDPSFAVVEVLSGNGIQSQEKAASDDASA